MFKPVSGQAYSSSDSIDLPFSFAVEEFYGTHCRSGSFSLVWGAVFTACKVFILRLFTVK